MGKEATAWHVLVFESFRSLLEKKEGFDLSIDQNPHSQTFTIFQTQYGNHRLWRFRYRELLVSYVCSIQPTDLYFHPRIPIGLFNQFNLRIG